ncbi:hypothetical protein E2C01_027498 [Portunus trituberculatus]|uniref:Uncharacterized protein n=1 Tax=Portunus trituberculatus TaxID=210409 RepID=A0A5B7ELS8_PORTR|nr:hypothetical protein [Portunus trituberculatus]
MRKNGTRGLVKRMEGCTTVFGLYNANTASEAFATLADRSSASTTGSAILPLVLAGRFTEAPRTKPRATIVLSRTTTRNILCF